MSDDEQTIRGLEAALERTRSERDQLRSRLQLADELADAVAHHHEMSRLAESDLSRRIDLAAAAYRLGTALTAYRTAAKTGKP